MIEQPSVDRPRRDWLVFVALGVLAIVLVVAAWAFNRGDGEEAASTSSPAAESTTTTTSTTTVTTTTQPTTTAPLSPEDQIRQAAVDLIEAYNELRMNPDPTRVGEIMSPDCRCFAAEQGSLQDLLSQGHKYADPSFEVLAVKLDGTTAGVATVRLALQDDQTVIVDSNGAVVERRPAGEHPVILSLVLEQDAAGAWLIFEFATIGDPSPEVSC